MANLTHGSDSWTGSNIQNSKQQTYKFSTAGKYSDKDISLTVTAKSGSATTPTTTITANPTLSTTKETNGYKVSVSKSQNITPSVTEGWISSGTVGTVSVSGSAYIPEAIGDIIMTPGSGNVTGSNVTLSESNTSGISVTGKGTVSSTAKITTAGYTPTNNSFATGSSTSSNSQTKYITGVTLTSGKSFQVTDTINTWNWTIDSNGNVTIS